MWALVLVLAGYPFVVAHTPDGKTCEALAERLNRHAPKVERYLCAFRREA